ncbi:hypothetical protein DH2020_004278 [Rehmannia glutinosa]|uniref:Uncharacterized protein n=1 Tax=Rehmannia glutinosa TaxID=99300 RepID=A0ABR0XP25_REHGL
MNYIFWNIRGIGNIASRNALKALCQKHKPSILAICEPKVDISLILDSYWSSLGLNFVTQNFCANDRVDIWVFCDSGHLCFTTGSVFFPVCCSAWVQFSSMTFHIAFAHGLCDHIARRTLWLDLRNLGLDDLLLIGDFNMVLGHHERSGSGILSQASCQDFRDFLEDVCLFAVPTTGNSFTWCSPRMPLSLLQAKLDRALATCQFFSLWQQVVKGLVLPRIGSDHHTILVSCSSSINRGPVPFHFQRMWVSHDTFRDLVTAFWVSPCMSPNPLLRVMRKLKRLRQAIKGWNRYVFGDVNCRMEHQMEQVRQIQADIEILGYTAALQDKELDAQMMLSQTLLSQSEFLKQKARSAWLKDVDRNTAFFYRRSHICNGRTGIQGLLVDGSYTDDTAVLGDHIISFYKELFADTGGSTSDYTLVDQVITPRVGAQDNASLTAIPSDSEIKEAVFDTDSNSSPGPDGFGGYFSKHCWDTIEMDIKAAVRSFFVMGVLPVGCNSSFVVLVPKSKGADRVEEFRPIILSNFLFKTVTKIWPHVSG